MMENQNNNLNTQPTETVMEIKPRRVWWKFAVGAVIILILAGGGYWAWDKYFSSEARENQRLQKQVEAYQAWENRYKEAMKNDAYGGRTPAETLSMFIDVLRKRDIDLITKYFLLGEDGNPRKEVVDGLQKVKEENRFQSVADTVSRAVYNKSASSEDTAWFTVDNKEGIAEYTIILKLNKYSGVWKIESL